jgi:hypothetical protein
MSLKIIETRISSYNSLNEAPNGLITKVAQNTSDFGKGILHGIKSEVKSKFGLKDEFALWLKARRLFPIELPGVRSGQVYRSNNRGNIILLFINRDDDGLIYFECNKIKVPIELVGLIYSDWNDQTDTAVLREIAKKNKLELLDGFSNAVYDKVVRFITSYRLNIFFIDWADIDKEIFNEAVDTGKYNTKKFNTLLMDKIADALNTSNISNSELIRLLGRKPRNVKSRHDLCVLVIKKVYNLSKIRYNKKEDQKKQEPQQPKTAEDIMKMSPEERETFFKNSDIEVR